MNVCSCRASPERRPARGLCLPKSPKRIDAVHEPQEHLNVRFALQGEILLGIHCQGGFLVVDNAVKVAALAFSISLESLVHERAQKAH